MEGFILLVIAVGTIVTIQILTGVTIFQSINVLFTIVLSLMQKKSGKTYAKNKRDFIKMSKTQKKKSLKYKFHTFINEILLDLNFISYGITVEGMTVLLQAIALLAAGFLFSLFYGWNIIIRALVSATIFFVIFGVLVAVLFLMARTNHAKRKTALMDAEDILCADMNSGLVSAVESSINSFDPIVRPAFKRFLDEIYDRNVDINTAIDELNRGCGVQFNLFCEKAKIFERERRPGMEQVFRYNITKNAFTRSLDRDCSKAFSLMNQNFWMSMLVIVVFIGFTMLTFDGMIEFYFSAIGKIILILMAIMVSLTFIFIQYVQSVPFMYGRTAFKSLRDGDGEKTTSATDLININTFFSEKAIVLEEFVSKKDDK